MKPLGCGVWGVGWGSAARGAHGAGEGAESRESIASEGPRAQPLSDELADLKGALSAALDLSNDTGRGRLSGCGGRGNKGELSTVERGIIEGGGIDTERGGGAGGHERGALCVCGVGVWCERRVRGG